jgi:hypothetical protein
MRPYYTQFQIECKPRQSQFSLMKDQDDREIESYFDG